MSAFMPFTPHKYPSFYMTIEIVDGLWFVVSSYLSMSGMYVAGDSK